MTTNRISTSSRYQAILAGLRENTFTASRSQRELATGVRISRPSDDPTGSSRLLLLDRRVAETQR